jgi:hypothetical protein
MWIERATSHGWRAPVAEKDRAEFIRWLTKQFAKNASTASYSSENSSRSNQLVSRILNTKARADKQRKRQSASRDVIRRLKKESHVSEQVLRLLMDEPETANLLTEREREAIAAPPCGLGQMFGFGDEIQTEVGDNRDKILLFAFWYESPFLSLGGAAEDTKLWLETSSLEANDWQETLWLNNST